jgi:hypothetical protein
MNGVDVIGSLLSGSLLSTEDESSRLNLLDITEKGRLLHCVSRSELRSASTGIMPAIPIIWFTHLALHAGKGVMNERVLKKAPK